MPLRLGSEGIHKHIHVGYRKQEQHNKHIETFITLAKNLTLAPD